MKQGADPEFWVQFRITVMALLIIPLKKNNIVRGREKKLYIFLFGGCGWEGGLSNLTSQYKNTLSRKFAKGIFYEVGGEGVLNLTSQYENT